MPGRASSASLEPCPRTEPLPLLQEKSPSSILLCCLLASFFVFFSSHTPDYPGCLFLRSGRLSEKGGCVRRWSVTTGRGEAWRRFHPPSHKSHNAMGSRSNIAACRRGHLVPDIVQADPETSPLTPLPRLYHFSHFPISPSPLLDTDPDASCPPPWRCVHHDLQNEGLLARGSRSMLLHAFLRRTVIIR